MSNGSAVAAFAGMLTLGTSARVDFSAEARLDEVVCSVEMGHGGNHEQPSWQQSVGNPCV